MSDKLRRIILILAFALVVILIGILIYYLFFRPFITPTPPAVTPTPALNILPGITNVNRQIVPSLNILPNINLPTPAPGTEVTVPPGQVISPSASGGLTSFAILETSPSGDLTLSNNGTDVIYYNKETGFFYKITPDGERKLYSDTPFKNVEKVTWSNNNQKAVLEYADGSNIIYDFQEKQSTTLPAHWQDFTFSNDSTKIAFEDIRLDVDNRYIAVANTDGTDYRKIEPIANKDKDVYITWSPNNQYVALFRESADLERSTVYPIGFNGEDFRSFTVEGRD